MQGPTDRHIGKPADLPNTHEAAPPKIVPMGGHSVTVKTGKAQISSKALQTAREKPEPPAKPSLSRTMPTKSDPKIGGVFQKTAGPNAEKLVKIASARASLVKDSAGSSPQELMQKLSSFNAEVKQYCQKGELIEGRLFDNINSPEETRLGQSVHANWLDDTKSFAGFMYPSLETRAAALEAFMNNGIDRHAHLANDFVVWLQHDNTGPVFPMSSKTFESMNGERKIKTELGEVTLKYGPISEDAAGNRTGLLTISDNGKTRTIEWPLDSLELKPGLRIELASTGDHETYVYKNSDNQTLHTLEVNSVLWKDFEGIDPSELHHLARRLVEANHASAGCRAGVGRTGTLFVATKMVEWAKENQPKKLTNEQLLGFIAEGRVNRDSQLVQTDRQMELLVRYMSYLNDNPDLSLEARVDLLMSDLSADENMDSQVCKDVTEKIKTTPNALDILKNPSRKLTASDEVFLDSLLEALTDPITGELFTDPVRTPYGHTFEREGLIKWFEKQQEHRGDMGFSPHLKSTCPLTRQELKASDLKEDIFAQRLKSLLVQRASLLAPATAAGNEKIEELDAFLMNEPLNWCRMLSAVMPQNSYFVRRKGFGGANDFVLEFRGKVKVQKCSFQVTAEGRLQPTTPSSPSFDSAQELANWLSTRDKKNGDSTSPPVHFTQEKINMYNNSMGKDAFMANLHKDEVSANTVKHLEQIFVDSEVKPLEPEIYSKGYVRAGISPSSFPCFTYVRGGSAKRCCINNGKLCKVDMTSVGKPKTYDACKKTIKENPKLTEAQKEEFLKELELVKDKLNYNSTITLFRPTDQPLEELQLAPLKQEKVEASKVSAYTVISFDE